MATGVFGKFSGCWIPVAYPSDVEEGPIRVEVMAVPVALWKRNPGEYAAIVDRCPHRGARLSQGTVQGGLIQCPYHGWKFDAAGLCRHIPAPEIWPSPQQAKVPAFVCREAYGIIWLSDQLPENEPLCGIVPIESYIRYSFSDVVSATLMDVVENLLDISHFPFVHAETFSTPLGVTALESVNYQTTDFGFESTYSVPIEAKSSFAGLIGTLNSHVTVRSLFVAPLSQIFHVRYDTGLRYSSVQTLCPVAQRLTRLFQFAFAEEPTSSEEDQRLGEADKAIWVEDRNILESLQPVIETLPADFVGTASSLSTLRRHILLALGGTPEPLT